MKIQGVTGGYKEIQGKLQGVTGGYRGLRGLQGITGGSQGVTMGYTGLQRVTRNYILQRFTTKISGVHFFYKSFPF